MLLQSVSDTSVSERGTALMWMFDPGDSFDRSRELLAEAERERAFRLHEAMAPRSGNGRRSRLRLRVGIDLIRRGEELAGIGADHAVRFS